MEELQNQGATFTLDEKEGAVHQHRNWVRVTHACNLRCAFCLDADAQFAYHRPFDEVADEIRRGFHGPRDRLILSGGEASTHPEFLRFIHFGKHEVGYDRVQTVTNGNMYAYKSFAKAALDAGLGETTFSMHGHNSNLHDRMVGVKGAFKTALRGLMNVLEDGRAIVNIDVCINKMNYRYLEEIIDFYKRLGVYEYDLLQVIPFGRAWKNRDKMMYDLDAAFPSLNRAFLRSRRPDTVIWTNRFPVHYLEGVEDLIQDPHKFYDEVRGRFWQYDQYFKEERMLFCEGPRCNYCFLNRYCHRLFQAFEDHKGFVQRRFAFGLSDASSADAIIDRWLRFVRGRRPADFVPRSLYVRAAAPDAAARFLARIEGPLPADVTPPAAPTPGEAAAPATDAEPTELRLHIDDAAALATAMEAPEIADVLARARVLTVETDDPRLIARIVRAAPRLTALTKLELPLVKPLTALYLRLKPVLEALGNVVLWLPNYERYADAQSLLPDLPAFKAALGNVRTIRTRNVPVCLTPAPVAEENRSEELPVNALAADGTFDVFSYTNYDINERYYSHSQRCNGCVYKPACRGLHIQAVRTLGYKILTPLKTVDPGIGELPALTEEAPRDYSAFRRADAPPDDAADVVDTGKLVPAKGLGGREIIAPANFIKYRP